MAKLLNKTLYYQTHSNCNILGGYFFNSKKLRYKLNLFEHLQFFEINNI